MFARQSLLSAICEKKAEEESFKVIRTARYISPNQARNLGLRYVLDRTILDCADSEYVVFVENDVIVKPGWLTQLVACAEETNAAVVGAAHLYWSSSPSSYS